jgi:hypothetical protein
MAQYNYLTVIYGVIFAFVLFFIIRMLYSVYYTPGSTTLYNSPVTQALFPSDNKKLFPSWGYNKLGMYDGQKFKFGQGSFWPESGKGFKPNKFGSPGASPTGGMRPSFPIPSETQLGYWGFSPKAEDKVELNIYDNSSQHVEYNTPVGWWNS